MTEFETASLTLRTIIGMGQIGLIGYGIHRMGRAGDQREKRLEALIERTSR